MRKFYRGDFISTSCFVNYVNFDFFASFHTRSKFLLLLERFLTFVFAQIVKDVLQIRYMQVNGILYKLSHTLGCFSLRWMRGNVGWWCGRNFLAYDLNQKWIIVLKWTFKLTTEHTLIEAKKFYFPLQLLRNLIKKSCAPVANNSKIIKSEVIKSLSVSPGPLINSGSIFISLFRFPSVSEKERRS